MKQIIIAIIIIIMAGLCVLPLPSSFQGDADLTRDGVVGPLTWSALDTALRPDRCTVTIGGLTESTAGQYGGEMRLEGGDAA